MNPIRAYALELARKLFIYILGKLSGQKETIPEEIKNAKWLPAKNDNVEVSVSKDKIRLLVRQKTMGRTRVLAIVTVSDTDDGLHLKVEPLKGNVSLTRLTDEVMNVT